MGQGYVNVVKRSITISADYHLNVIPSVLVMIASVWAVWSVLKTLSYTYLRLTVLSVDLVM